jgi:parallel beta-helix repeat protein
MSVQKNKTVLAATLALIAVFLLGGVSFSFFPIQQPASLQDLPSAAHIQWTKPPASDINLTINGPVSTSTGSAYVVTRNFPMDTICIGSDGHHNATVAPILQQGNTYTLTGSMVNKTILVQKDNIILDGAGFTLQGWSQTIGDIATGISVSNRANVTITNFAISQYTQPIWLQNSSQITLSNNKISYGYPLSVLVNSSSNNTITGNILSNGILQLDNSSYNTVSHNTITGSYYVGVADYGGKENKFVKNNFVNTYLYCDGWESTVTENSIINAATCLRIEGQRITVSSNVFVNCTDGISINGLSCIISKNSAYNVSTCVLFNDNPYQPLTGNNTFYDNNFEGYDKTVHYWNSSTYADHWDNGKEGNYWSSYNGSDSNGDGVGDSPYFLAANCTDNYPLMQPYAAASSDIELGTMFFGAAAVTALAGATIIICVYAKFKGRNYQTQ